MKLPVLLSLLVAANSFAATCDADLSRSIPTEFSRTQIQKLCRENYITSYDLSAKIPLWANYFLTAEKSQGCIPRAAGFKADQDVPAKSRSYQTDYAKSGYDMGHMVNAADMEWDQTAMLESFLTSNITPQTPNFNRGIWKKLETRVRALAKSRDTKLLIHVGDIYQPGNPTIGNGVVVPNAFYKIIIDTKTNEYEAYLFNLPAVSTELSTYKTSVFQIERRTGLKFGITAANVSWDKPTTFVKDCHERSK